MAELETGAVLFSSILSSSIWSADDQTRIVWITMLALADENGVVFGTIPGLSAMARVSIEDTEKAIKNLESPDQYSRSPDYEGRRIAKADGGWLILNYKKYITKAKIMARKEYLKAYCAKYYRHKKECGNMPDKNINEKPDNNEPPKGLLHFDKFWKSYPRKVGKGAAKKAWIKNNCDAHIDKILKTLETYKQTEQWRKDNGQFIPHPSTWLNQERWEDEPVQQSIKQPIKSPVPLSQKDFDAIDYFVEKIKSLYGGKDKENELQKVYTQIKINLNKEARAELKKRLKGIVS